MHSYDEHLEEEQIRYLLMTRLTHEYAERMRVEMQNLVERYPNLGASMPLLDSEQEAAQVGSHP